MDIVPDIKISLIELNQRTKQRAMDALEKAGIGSLGAVGAAFWADILFVTGRARASLGTEQLEALGKASAGLGYAATQYALLSEVGTGDRDETANEPTGSRAASDKVADSPLNEVQQLEAYLQALGADTLVFLEAETAQSLQGFAHNLEGKHPYIHTVTVTDFFASLATGDDQQARKQKAWQELQAAKRQPSMR